MLLNCAKRQSATETALLRAAADPRCLALLLQEPWHDHRSLPPHLPGFIMHNPADAPERPNCVTYVREGVPARQKFSHAASFLEIEVTVGTLTFSILNFYSPGVPDHLADLLATRFTTPPASCLLMGDFNAHHPWWSAEQGVDSESRQRGRAASDAIAAWLQDHRFRLHNTPGVLTRFPMQRGTTLTGREYTPAVLDLALSRGPIEEAVISWGIDDSADSDHRGITLHLSFDADVEPVKPSSFRDWRSADWDVFDEHISRLDMGELSVPTVTKALLEAIEAAAPLKIRRPGKKYVPWWTPELARLQHRVKSARRRARDSMAPTAGLVKRAESPLWAAYDALNAAWKKAFTQARSKYAADMLATVNQQNVWRVLKRHLAHRRATPTIDGADDFEGKCAAFRGALFPANDAPERLQDGLVQGTADLRGEWRPVSRTEVDRVVARLHYGSAVGPDAVSYEVVKRLHQRRPEILPRLFTTLFETGTHPDEWKTARCVVIPKPGKRTYTTAGSYRPISLLSCFGKVFEVIAAKRLANAAARCGALADSQMGARAQHSAIDALLRVLDPFAHSLSQVYRKKGSTPMRPGMLTHDIEGAFNNTHPALLDDVLRMRTMPTYLRTWVRAFNTDRRLGFALDARNEEPQPFRCGLPQGSPVSPVLFLIYANAALERSNRAGGFTDTSYVDDVSVVASRTSPDNLIRDLQTRTNEQIERAGHLKLSLAPGKSELILGLPATSKYRKNADKIPHHHRVTATMTVAGRTVAPTSTVTYLGVVIDDGLGFRDHAARAASKGLQALGAMGFLRGNAWSIPAYIAHHLVFAAVLPQMMWASPIWWNGKSNVFESVKMTYHAAARWITGLPMSTSIWKLLTVAQLPPLKAYLDYLTLRYAIRLRFLPASHALAPEAVYAGNPPRPDYPNRLRLSHLTRALAAGSVMEDRFCQVHDAIPSATSPHPDKETDPIGIHGKWVAGLPNLTMLLYTDGSKLEDGRTGSGWVAYCVGDRVARKVASGHCHLGSRAEVYDAELHAVQEALTALRDSIATTPATAYVCVDNQSALETLATDASATQFSRAAVRAAADLSRAGWKMQSIWTPAHVGITGNEAADAEAKSGAASTAPPCEHARATKTWMLAESKRQLRTKWTQELPDARPGLSFPAHLRGYQWVDTRALWRLYCRRTPTDRDPARGPVAAEPCPCGDGFLSGGHAFIECRLFRRARKRMQTTSPGRLSRAYVLDPKHTQAVITFLRTTGLGFRAALRYEDGEMAGMDENEEEDGGVDAGLRAEWELTVEDGEEEFGLGLFE
jgi:ribonuclease HI